MCDGVDAGAQRRWAQKFEWSAQNEEKKSAGRYMSSGGDKVSVYRSFVCNRMVTETREVQLYHVAGLNMA